MASPASRRPTNCSLSSITEHSFHGICTSSPELVVSLEGKASTRMMGKGTHQTVTKQTWIRCPLPQTPSPASPKQGKSVTYVSGTKCYPCVRLVTKLRIFSRPSDVPHAHLRVPATFHSGQVRDNSRSAAEAHS